MTTVLNQTEILEEVVVKLRNADILTTTQRGVSTTGQTTSLSGTGMTISVPNVKNVRTVTVNSVDKTFGTDYTVNYNSGTNCEITFATAQTGTGVATYDYGTDKIWPGYPRNDISLANIPQIAVEFIDLTSVNGGFGNVNRNEYDISIVAYDFKKEDVRGHIKAIRSFLVANMNNFHGLKVVKPRLIGPIVVAEFEKFKDRVFKQNIDFNSSFNLEVN